MIAEELREGAHAIVEHAKNLSGDAKARRDLNPATSENTVNLASNGALPEVAGTGPVQGGTSPIVYAAAQFPSESGHFYDPRTGNQVELPPRTWTATAIKRGYVPGVTTITKVAHKEAIQRWMVNRAILFTRDESTVYNIKRWEEKYLLEIIWNKLNADSDAITGRGKELHGAIEQYAQRVPSDSRWDKHIRNLVGTLSVHGLGLADGNTEHSFATSRYGGKIDWHNDEWLLDFKTKPKIPDPKWALRRKGTARAYNLFDTKEKAQHEADDNNESFPRNQWYIEERFFLAYPEHAQQLAAYSRGLWETGPTPIQGLRRCANVFIGVEDAKVVFHEWSEKDLLQGWEEFECFLNAWWKIATRNMKK